MIMENKILDLPLKKKWYEMIESGVKTEEYREIKPYWCNRLLYYITLGIKEYWEPVLKRGHELIKQHSVFAFSKSLIKDYGTRGYTHIRFRYGYTNRTMVYEIKELVIGKGKPEWGAPDEEVFIFKLGQRI